MTGRFSTTVVREDGSEELPHEQRLKWSSKGVSIPIRGKMSTKADGWPGWRTTSQLEENEQGQIMIRGCPASHGEDSGYSSESDRKPLENTSDYCFEKVSF